MQRFSQFLTLIVLAALMTGCASPQATDTTTRRDGFAHMVFFWMAEDATVADREALMRDCKTYLGLIETVTHIEVGTPAGTPREVVDNSYGVALLVHFADSAGHDVYQDHPLHYEFIERNEHRWSTVQVYDYLPSGS